MSEQIAEKVVVGLVSGLPKWLIWRERRYQIEKIGLHHTYREGRTLYHVFSVVSDTLFLKLRLDTENLTWCLEEVDNGI